jgi:hypothetical protein
MAHGIKTGGRQKGTPNKATAKLRQLVTDSVERYMSADMMADLDKVTPAERLKHLHELLKLTVPKPVEFDPEQDRQDNTLRVIVKRMDNASDGTRT